MRSEFEHHFRYLVPKRDFTDSEPSLLIDEFTDQRFPIPFLLVDENHKELVVDSLWEAAGRPQDIAGGGNASLKGSQPGPSWTRSNLDQADMQTLVDLQAVADAAGYNFKRAAPMAMKLVSCTRGTSAEQPSWTNWSPEKATKTATINRQWDDGFKDLIKARDWSELSDGRAQNLCLYLDAAVFRFPSDYQSNREAYQHLKKALFPQDDLSPWVELWCSPLSAVTLAREARQRADIPNEATFFSFCYPMRPKASEEEEEEQQQQQHAPPWNERDPFVQFLLNGGFIYFDFQYEICAINSVGFEASDEYDTAFGTSAIFFAQPAHISPTCMAELDRLERWWPVTVSDVQDSGGLVYFAWILPSEYVGDMIFPPLGGFAYLTGTQGFFYPVAVDGMRGDAAS